MRKRLFGGIGLGVALALLGSQSPSGATEYMLGGNPAHVMGYIDQGAAYGIGGDHYDTKKGFQSAIFSALLEGDYVPTPELKLFASGKLTADWAYDILHNNQEWQDKGFSRSRNELYLDTGWRKMLHEAHVTWSSGNLNVRAGKQIVAWGETDGLRIMDQINPLDQRRGLADVEFENTIIPIWLVKTEYFFKPQSSWLQDLGLELVFNPNADFQPNRGLEVGNDKGGIWAPNIDLGQIPVAFDPETGLPVAFAPARLGSFVQRIDQPRAWDRQGMEFGARLKAVINDKIITLNYFNGRENAPITRVSGPPVGVEPASDGVLLLHLPLEGFFPRQRFAGATFSGDFTSLKASSLGGVAPVLRLEGFYAFGETYATTEQPLARFVTHNEIRYAVGVDWKIKVPFLNPRAYFTISPQFFHKKILGYPSDFKLVSTEGPVDENNYATTLLVTTTYFHNKIVPLVFWLRDITNNAHLVKAQVTYVYSQSTWQFTVGTLLLSGEEKGKGFQPLENKDQVYATIKYRF
ncbi:MAG: hypothetical protein HZA60_08240 [Deltaproteobacteria bacterium]|nr:hypothetical protein [Deltaproteobacteria bacterium]